MNLLTEGQMGKMGDKHGYFQFRDAQGDVSRAYADEAIERYLQMAAAGSQMLDALINVLEEWDGSETHMVSSKTIEQVCRAINAAEKYPPKKEG